MLFGVSVFGFISPSFTYLSAFNSFISNLLQVEQKPFMRVEKRFIEAGNFVLYENSYQLFCLLHELFCQLSLLFPCSFLTVIQAFLFYRCDYKLFKMIKKYIFEIVFIFNEDAA
jgi:hypothetical protein